MAGVQASELAIAVSNAGGLGALPCAMLSLDQMRTELSEIRDRTRKPFNSNQPTQGPQGLRAAAELPESKQPGGRQNQNDHRERHHERQHHTHK
jgi:NAD(P)H-dependent flavin oxidoreductase YrpB (nitropropane dioxygenase family)